MPLKFFWGGGEYFCPGTGEYFRPAVYIRDGIKHPHSARRLPSTHIEICCFNFLPEANLR